MLIIADVLVTLWCSAAAFTLGHMFSKVETWGKIILELHMSVSCIVGLVLFAFTLYYYRSFDGTTNFIMVVVWIFAILVMSIQAMVSLVSAGRCVRDLSSKDLVS